MKKNFSENAVKKAIMVTRVAKIDEMSNFSKEAQEQVIKDYCKNNGFDIVQSYNFIGSYDTVIPEIDSMLNFIKTSETSIIVVFDKVDRMNHNLKMSDYFEQYRLSGKIELHFVIDKLVVNKNTKGSDLHLYTVLTMLANYYSEAQFMSIKDGLMKKGRSA